MKFFKMTALVTLIFAAAVQSAFAVGRADTVDEVQAHSFKCSRLAANELKRQTSSADVNEAERKVEHEKTTTVRSSM